MSDRRRKKMHWRDAVSRILFALSAVLFILVGVLAFQQYDVRINSEGSFPWVDVEPANPTVTPPAVSGKSEMINVQEALEAEGVEAAFAPGGAKVAGLSVLGQVLEADGQKFYVFIYPDPVSREAEQTALGTGPVALTNHRGTPVPGTTPRVFGGSNVIVIVVDPSEDLAARVGYAMEKLP